MILLCVVAALGISAQSKVYFTKEISPESLVKIYKALGVPAHGRVAVKISTGESGGRNYLKPELIRSLVDEVKGGRSRPGAPLWQIWTRSRPGPPQESHQHHPGRVRPRTTGSLPHGAPPAPL